VGELNRLSQNLEPVLMGDGQLLDGTAARLLRRANNRKTIAATREAPDRPPAPRTRGHSIRTQ
jgi:hypothetical protein